MIILDTDHLSFLERGDSAEAQRLKRRLSAAAPEEAATTIITYGEQTHGWFSYMARAQTLSKQIEAYSRLSQHLATFGKIPVIGFDATAAVEFQRLRDLRIRIGTFDLRIAAIALSLRATLLSRNLSDFQQVPELNVEDWSS